MSENNKNIDYHQQPKNLSVKLRIIQQKKNNVQLQDFRNL